MISQDFCNANGRRYEEIQPLLFQRRERVVFCPVYCVLSISHRIISHSVKWKRHFRFQICPSSVPVHISQGCAIACWVVITLQVCGEFIDPLLWFLWFKSCSEQAVHQLLHGANRSLLVIRCVGSPAPRENAGISTLDDHVLLITFREHLSYL